MAEVFIFDGMFASMAFDLCRFISIKFIEGI